MNKNNDMKNIKYSLLLLLAMVIFSCEKDIYKWDDKAARIQFTGDTLGYKTFIFEDETIVDDTIYLTVHTMGFTSNRDRYFKLKQTPIEGVANAVAGVHYIGLDAPEMKEYLKIPANEAVMKVPIIVMRDKSLKTSRVEMKLTITENEEFTFGELDSLSRRIIISDDYERPASYSSWLERMCFGTYSKVSHKFMHKVLSEQTKYVPDEAFFSMVSIENSHYYYSEMFGKALKKYNADPNNTDTPLTSEPILPEFPNGKVIVYKW